MFKKIYLIFILTAVFILSSCNTQNDGGQNGLRIVATLFPQYDFAKQIAGDKAEVTLLLPPGTESHSYDPKPGDIIEIQNADLFFYTGSAMEPWAETIIKSISDGALKAVDCSENIKLLHNDGHNHDADPHIWLNPENAAIMAENILGALIEKDPDNADFYSVNADGYKNKLTALDQDIKDVISKAKRNAVVFGGRFAYLYFLEHFGLDYITAYDSCAAHAEPSASQIVRVINYIKENSIPCIYYEELSDPKVARSIAEETGIEYLRFSTAHSVTKEEFQNGTGFLDIMYENLENLKVGLN